MAFGGLFHPRQLSFDVIDKNLANQEAWTEYGSLVLYARVT